MDKLLRCARAMTLRFRIRVLNKTSKVGADDKHGLASSESRGNIWTPTSQSTAAVDDAPPPYSFACLPPNKGSVVLSESKYTLKNIHNDPEDPYRFLYLFDTVFLIDDSSSMMGSRWRQVKAALKQIAPVCTSHNNDGIDLHFVNHESGKRRIQGKAPGGYYNIKEADSVVELFSNLWPGGLSQTRTRLENVLSPYFEQLRAAANIRDVKPLNLIVLTDAMPELSRQSPEPAILSFARELDQLQAPSYQVGIQFIQIGNDAGATKMLKALDSLSDSYGCRDICDTLKFGQDDYLILTADKVLTAVKSGVGRRWGNRRCL